jgi:putative transposase
MTVALRRMNVIGVGAPTVFEIGCDNGERVRVAFALDCCDRESMSFLATTGGIAGEDVRDLMVAAVEYRFGQVNRLPVTIEWLSDNGSCYVADETRSFGRPSDPGRRLSSNGMAEPRCGCRPWGRQMRCTVSGV